MRKSTLILLAVFLVLLVIALIAENPFGGRKGVEKPALFPGFDSTAVSVIEIHTRSDSTRLEKVDGLWQVASEGSYPADQGAVGELLAAVRSFERREIASRNPEKRSIYQVDGSNLKATFQDPAGNTLAHLFVGKSGPDFSSSYVRADGSDEVVLARGYLRGIFDKGARGWRDRTIFKIDQNRILRFKTTRADTVITVATEDKVNWWIVEPDSAEARMNVVDAVLRAFSNLAADDFDPEVSAADAGLEDPWGTFTAHLEDGSDLTLLVGGKDDGSRWVAKPGGDMTFKVRTYRVRNLFKSLEELREPQEEETAESGGS